MKNLFDEAFENEKIKGEMLMGTKAILPLNDVPMADVREPRRYEKSLEKHLDKQVEKYLGQAASNTPFDFINAVIFGEDLMELDATMIIEWYLHKLIASEVRKGKLETLEYLKEKVASDEDSCARLPMPEADRRIYRKLANALLERIQLQIRELEA